jgi:hypothetical protein
VKKFAAGSIKMYPNPSNGLVNIQSAENMKSVKVYTMGGQLVREVNISDMMKANALTLDLNVVAGLYRVQIITAAGEMYSDFLSFQ